MTTLHLDYNQDHQMFTASIDGTTIVAGSFASLRKQVPDVDHFTGFDGRVYPGSKNDAIRVFKHRLWHLARSQGVTDLTNRCFDSAPDKMVARIQEVRQFKEDWMNQIGIV